MRVSSCCNSSEHPYIIEYVQHNTLTSINESFTCRFCQVSISTWSYPSGGHQTCVTFFLNPNDLYWSAIRRRRPKCTRKNHDLFKLAKGGSTFVEASHIPACHDSTRWLSLFVGSLWCRFQKHGLVRVGKNKRYHGRTTKKGLLRPTYQANSKNCLMEILVAVSDNERIVSN